MLRVRHPTPQQLILDETKHSALGHQIAFEQQDQVTAEQFLDQHLLDHLEQPGQLY
jgi:hypothetical protein